MPEASEIDPEIAAMGGVATALTPLDEDQRTRVLRWALDRYGVVAATTRHERPGDEGGSDEQEGGKQGSDEAGRRRYSSIEELFENGSAKTNMQKALLAAYWFQVVQGDTGFQSFALNAALKNLGIGIANITDALGSAEAQKPALVMQTAKTGKSRQARKTYKLTTAGVKSVEAMLASDGD